VASSGAFTGEGGGSGTSKAEQDPTDARSTGSVGAGRSTAGEPEPDGMDAAAKAGSASAGARSGALGETSRSTGASPGAPKQASASGTASTGGASSGPSGSRAQPGQTPPEPLDIPQPTAPRVDDQDEQAPEAAAVASPLAPLLGYWQQLDDGRRVADFAPGGHDLGLVAIRPTQRSLQVYRAWGDPPQLVVAAELRATFDPDGAVTLEETPSRPSRFFTAPLPLPGMPGRSATPAARPLPCKAAWTIEGDGLLRLDGSLYRRVDRATFDRSTTARAAMPVTAPAPNSAGATPGRPAEPGGGVDFFGARVRGGFVCFVCDISGSMSGDKMEALRREIVRTVRAMPAGTNWQVVFFDHAAHIFQRGWVQAGSADSEQLLRKVDGVGTGGGTDPGGALTFAFTQLDPVPHELFLLTDGQFGSDAVGQLRALNGGTDRTRIHTLGMGSDADVDTLQAIAKEHGGTFTHIAAQSGSQAPAGTP
jgi:hypothetical protein